MNKIYNLFDKNYVIKLLTEKVLPCYLDFVKIKDLKIIPYKKGIWGDDCYHVVIEFNTTFIDKRNKPIKLPIFCTAHSNEPRKNVFIAMKYLWEHGFGRGNLTSPHPLFYSNEYKASFYRGVKGFTLYHYIRNQDLATVEAVTINAAKLFAKLHKLPIDNTNNFNKNNSRIETTVPGVPHILESLKHHHSKYLNVYKKSYEIVIGQEKANLSRLKKLWLVHGDAHPENVIKMGKHKTGLIDFTDLCHSDFARDLGTFMQQLEYMCRRKIPNINFSKKITEIFLENYLKYAKIDLSNDLINRINLYNAWTTMRTATYFLIKDKPEPERGEALIKEFTRKLGI